MELAQASVSETGQINVERYVTAVTTLYELLLNTSMLKLFQSIVELLLRNTRFVC